ncbi:glycerol-3-phosphate 1-O-acyltransferase PlsY [Candidatus Pelagibacter sp.]|nr:glycerol-3-phosphate 1-O-acyltransferase PlsY [Candidatus Pelagibacter sp.]|tara:strand:+ start:1916 stop:2515 length:600 start_codon:yes stop_codon:yes gene_type:complete
MNLLNDFNEIFIIIVISYAFGSIPFGYLITKFFLKKDIRKIGSGNIGATNVLRTGNRIIGYSTLLLDVFKAILPLIIIKIYMNEYLFIASLSVFLGHVFPIWLKFKGGKGVATYVGILCCINLYLGIGFGFFWIITLIIFKYSSLSSLVASLSIPFIDYFILKNELISFYIIMFVLIFYTHRENIKRLVNKEESKTKIY